MSFKRRKRSNPGFSYDPCPFPTKALEFAERGIPVLPYARAGRADGEWFCSCGKRNCPQPGRHPLTPNGVRAASTDLDDIVRWVRIPDCNLSVIVPRGLVVLEVGNGLPMSILVQEEGRLPKTPSFTTVSGTSRYLLRVPYHVNILSAWSRYYPSVRTMAEGALVLVPPSAGPLGGDFAWLTPLAGNEIAPAPDWLVRDFIARDSRKGSRGSIPIERSEEDLERNVIEFPEIHGEEGSH